MYHFVIEYELEKVKSEKTKSYLEEVIANYNVGSYRSAIVTLYSIVIFDLLDKTKILAEIYNDQISIDILSKIETAQIDSPNSSKWEKLLINEIRQRTQLLNSVESQKIQHLVDERNFCAHPLYNNDYELINPNKEQVRAHIRNMFEIVFQKDALLSKKIMDELLCDLTEYYKKLGIDGVDNYLQNKYLRRFNNLTKSEVFKALWKFVLIVENKQCNENREINLFALIGMIKHEKKFYLNLINKERDYFSNIKPVKNNMAPDRYYKVGYSRINGILAICFYYPGVIGFLDKSVVESMTTIAESNININLLSYFLNDNLSLPLHFEKIHDKIFNLCKKKNNWFDASYYDCISGEIVKIMVEVFNENELITDLINFLVNYYTASPSFDSAKNIFYEIIRPNLSIFTKFDFKNMLKLMNENDQIYGSRDYPTIKEEFEYIINTRFSGKIDMSKYKNL